jgi:hypothetical protein
MLIVTPMSILIEMLMVFVINKSKISLHLLEIKVLKQTMCRKSLSRFSLTCSKDSLGLEERDRSRLRNERS